MRIGRVVGQITLNRCTGEFKGARLMIVQPHTMDVLRGRAKTSDETVIVWDELSATDGDVVAFSEGREGAMPFVPDKVPVDAYLSCILDAVNVLDGGGTDEA